MRPSVFLLCYSTISFSRRELVARNPPHQTGTLGGQRSEVKEEGRAQPDTGDMSEVDRPASLSLTTRPIKP